MQEHLAVHEGALQAPLPSPLQRVLPHQQRPRLPQREHPLVTARKITDVPGAGQRLVVRRKGLAQPADPLAQEIDALVRVLDVGADPPGLLRENLHLLLDFLDLLLAVTHPGRVRIRATLHHGVEVVVQARQPAARLLARSRLLAVALQGVVQAPLLDLELHLQTVDRRQLLLRARQVLRARQLVRPGEDPGHERKDDERAPPHVRPFAGPRSRIASAMRTALRDRPPARSSATAQTQNDEAFSPGCTPATRIWPSPARSTGVTASPRRPMLISSIPLYEARRSSEAIPSRSTRCAMTA